MALSVDVRHDLKRLEQSLGLYPREMLAAAVRAQNRTLSTLRRIAVGELAPDFAGMKRGAIRNQLKLRTATSRAPSAMLEFSAKRFRLWGNFNARQTKRGVRITRMPWRLESADGEVLPPQILEHAFIQRAQRTGQPNVFIRVGGKRYPISSIVVAGTAAAFRQRRLGTHLTALGRARFAIELRRDANYRLSMRQLRLQRAA